MVVFSAFYQVLCSLFLPPALLVMENLALRQQLLVLAPFDESTSASSPRSLVLERLVASVARLALHPRHREARDSYQMAPAGFQVLLALEV